MRCLSAYAMHYAITSQFLVTYVMHAIWTIYHVSWIIISKAYNFQIVHLNVNILEFIYQHSINNYHQESQSKASKDNLVLTTKCGIRDTHKGVHTYNHYMPPPEHRTTPDRAPRLSKSGLKPNHKHAILCHTSGPTRPWDSLEPQSRISVPKLVPKTSPLRVEINQSRKNPYLLERSPCRVDGL